MKKPIAPAAPEELRSADSTPPTAAGASVSQVPVPPPSRTSLAPKEYDFFKVVQDYLDRAAKVIDLEPFVRTILS